MSMCHVSGMFSCLYIMCLLPCSHHAYHSEKERLFQRKMPLNGRNMERLEREGRKQSTFPLPGTPLNNRQAGMGDRRGPGGSSLAPPPGTEKLLRAHSCLETALGFASLEMAPSVLPPENFLPPSAALSSRQFALQNARQPLPDNLSAQAGPAQNRHARHGGTFSQADLCLCCSVARLGLEVPVSTERRDRHASLGLGNLGFSHACLRGSVGDGLPRGGRRRGVLLPQPFPPGEKPYLLPTKRAVLLE